MNIPNQQQPNPNPEGMAAFLCFAFVLLVVWFVMTAMPVFIAWSRGHPNAMAITALTVCLGWTFWGWVGALVWSLWHIPQEPALARRHRRSVYDERGGPPRLPRPTDAIWRKGN